MVAFRERAPIAISGCNRGCTWYRSEYICYMSPDREMGNPTPDTIESVVLPCDRGVRSLPVPESISNAVDRRRSAGGRRVARQWLRENPCPDASLDQHLEAILDAYAEMSTATVFRA